MKAKQPVIINQQPGWRRALHQMWADKVLYLLLLPTLIYFILFRLWPIWNLRMAFYNYRARGPWEWVGLKWFKMIFDSSAFGDILWNTLVISFMKYVLLFPFFVIFALMLNEIRSTRFRKYVQVVSYLPHLLSWVVVAYLVYALLNASNGFINNSVFPALGIEPFDWYAAPSAWPVILVLVYLWKNAGYNAIVYMASIAGIDKEIFEAAKIDGASKMKQIFAITLPMLRPTITIMTLMSIGRIFYSDFGLFYQTPMDSGTLFKVTQTIDTYVYRGLMEQGDVGMSSAAGVYQSMVGFVLVMAANYIVRKKDPDNALF